MNENEIVVWVSLPEVDMFRSPKGEPYEYRIVYCPGRSPVIPCLKAAEADGEGGEANE